MWKTVKLKFWRNYGHAKKIEETVENDLDLNGFIFLPKTWVFL
jgi:hypothetical protein